MVTIRCGEITEEMKEVAKTIADAQHDNVVVIAGNDRYEIRKTPREGETQPH